MNLLALLALPALLAAPAPAPRPGQMTEWLARARVAIRSGHLSEAEPLLHRVLDNDPRSGRATALLASIHHRRRLFPEALALYRRASRTTRLEPAERRELAELWLQGGFPRRALDDLSGDRSPEALLLRARALGRLGRGQEALELVRAATGMTASPDITLVEGEIRLGMGDHAAAIRLLEEHRRRAPQAVDGRVTLVQAFLSASRHQDALRLMDELLAEELPRDIRSLLIGWQAHALDATGDREGSLRSLERLASRDEVDGALLARMGRLAADLGRKELARSYLRAAREAGFTLDTAARVLAGPPDPEKGATGRPGDAGPIRFSEASRESGLDFAGTVDPPILYLPQILGPGVTVFDYDSDGYDDVLLVSPGRLPGRPPPGSAAPPRPSGLFRNNGSGGFEEVTDRCGLALHGYVLSTLAADLDNDGHPDLVTSGWGVREAWRNLGDGTFVRWSGLLPGTDPGLLAPGASAGDVDRDGWLDLFLTSYTRLDPASLPRRPIIIDPGRGDPLLVMGTQPGLHEGAPDQLLRNRPGQSFEEVTAAAGIAGAQTDGRGLQALICDFDGNMWPDVFVANDMGHCLYHHNQGAGRFREEGRRYWLDDPRGNMGLAAGDYDGDGDLDLAISHWIRQSTALHQNLHPVRGFADTALRSGLGKSDPAQVGWGLSWADFDGDGWLDLFMVNGQLSARTYDPATCYTTATNRPIPQTPTLYRGGPAGFTDITRLSGLDFEPYVSRGSALLDQDRDGRMDIVANNLESRAVYFRNQSPAAGWIGFFLVGTRSSRDAAGGLIRLVGPAGLRGTRTVLLGSSYLATETRSLHFGLGALPAGTGVEAEVRWPSGTVQPLSGLAPGRYHRMVEPSDAR